MKAWISFLVRYALVAAAGTALIAWASSSPRVVELLRGNAATEEEASQETFAGEIEPVSPDPAFAETAEAIALPAQRSRAPLPARPESDVPPESPVSTGHWAVVLANEARLYDASGKYLRRLPPGTLLDVLGLVMSGAEEFAVSTIVPSDPDGPRFLIRTADLDLRSGSVHDVSEHERALRIQRAELLGRLRSLQNPPATAVRRDNPHAEEYRTAMRAYREYWANVNDLKSKWENATGEDHIRYGEELRKLKGLDIRIGIAYEQAKEKYDEWNRRRPAASTDRERIESLQAALVTVNQSLRRYDDHPGARPPQ